MKGLCYLLVFKCLYSRHQRIKLPFVVALDLLLLQDDGLLITDAVA